MTRTAGLPPLVQLRLALGSVTGARVVLPRALLEELLTMLDARPAAPPATEPATPAEPAEDDSAARRPAVTPRRGQAFVTLGATTADARRLAAAAWAVSPERLAEHGPWADLAYDHPDIETHQIEAARAAIAHLLEEAP
jgi:hypothetical protein